MTSATRAVATHIMARKTLDLPTPNFLIAMAHREKARVFLAMMCVATALVAEVIGREHLSLFQWLGVFIAVLGIVLSQYCCTKKSEI